MHKKAFSLIELSIVLLIIGIIIAGVTQSSRLIGGMRLAVAASMTQSAPVASITGLSLWLEPTSENAFATGTSGTYTNVSQPEEDDSIGRWNDLNPQSTSKLDAIQATSGNQPTYKSSAINNLPALLFTNASAQALVSDFNMDYTVTPNLTFFVVFRRVGTGSYQCIFGNGIGDGRILCPSHADVPGAGMLAAASWNAISGGDALNTPLIISAVLKDTVTNGSVVYLNGNTSVTFSENETTSGASTTTIGADGAGAGAPWDGYIGEVIVFNRALKTSERQAIERYLGKKWNVVVP